MPHPGADVTLNVANVWLIPPSVIPTFARAQSFIPQSTNWIALILEFSKFVRILLHSYGIYREWRLSVGVGCSIFSIYSDIRSASTYIWKFDFDFSSQERNLVYIFAKFTFGKIVVNHRSPAAVSRANCSDILWVIRNSSDCHNEQENHNQNLY